MFEDDEARRQDNEGQERDVEMRESRKTQKFLISSLVSCSLSYCVAAAVLLATQAGFSLLACAACIQWRSGFKVDIFEG